MNRRGCAVGCLASLMLVVAGVAWLNFALDYERERAVSPDGRWVASAYIYGAPLTAANEKVHLWRWWQPHFRWLGCEVLEAHDEAPIRFVWVKTNLLTIQHGFREGELKAAAGRCGSIQVFLVRSLQPCS